MRLFDTHCHIDSKKFDQDRDQVLTAAGERGIDKIVVPATTQNCWSDLLKICSSNERLYPALGLHPVFLAHHKFSDLLLLESALVENKPVAVGEIGLDFYIKNLDQPSQINLLDAQLSTAKSADLPVILHCRKAYDEMINLLSKYQLKGGVAHAFNGNLQQAGKLIDLGYKLGFGGMLTYQRSTKLRKLAQKLPLESIVLETDSPDMTVAQHRGERNSPEFLPYVLESLSEIRSESAEQIAEQTYANSLEIFAV